MSVHGPEKPDPAKAKSTRKRKQSSSDDSDSDFEKVVSKAATSKVLLLNPFALRLYIFKVVNLNLRIHYWYNLAVGELNLSVSETVALDLFLTT